jgi:hypothetical protein
MSISNFNLLLQNIPQPATPNQQFCGLVNLAPGLFAQAYVPTAAERAGDFSAFGGPLIDPTTGQPFPGSIIPLSRLPDPFAWRVSSVSSPLVISHLANGGGWKTRVILVNTDKQAAGFQMKFWDKSGTALVLPLGSDGNVTQVSDTIQAGSSRIIQTDGSGGLIEGWAELAAPQSVGGTSIFTYNATSEAGVPLYSAGGTQLYVPFDNTSRFATGLALANPGTQTASVQATFVDESGASTPIATPITVPGRGHFADVLNQGVFAAANGRRGVLQLSSNAEVHGLGIRYNGAAFTSLEALSAVPASAKTIAHLANAGGWKTTIILINTDTQPAPFILKFWDNTGNPLILPLGVDGAKAQVSDTIQPGRSRIIEADGSGGPITAEGWAELTTSFKIGCTSIFTFKTGYEAAVPLSIAGGTHLITPFDNTPGFATGLALANAGAQAATVQATFVDEFGVSTPIATPIMVPASGHFADVLNHGVFAAAKGKRGVVQLTSNVPLFGIAIRYDGAAFTSLPVLTR